MKRFAVLLTIAICMCFATCLSENKEDNGFHDLFPGLYEIDDDLVGTFIVENNGETAVINIWDSIDAYKNKDDNWDEAYKHFYSVTLYSGSTSSVTLTKGELMQVVSYDSKCRIKRFKLEL